MPSGAIPVAKHFFLDHGSLASRHPHGDENPTRLTKSYHTGIQVITAGIQTRVLVFSQPLPATGGSKVCR